ncbi:PP2C family protein-serine/threonine phosphatase [Streptomyces sp. NPDC001076]
MGELTAALAEAVTSQDVAEVFAKHVLAPFGADGLMFTVLEGGRVHVIAGIGYPQEFLEAVRDTPVSASAPALDVVRTRVPRFVESSTEFLQRYPTMRGLWELAPKEAWAFLPLMVSGRVLGVCAVSFGHPRSFGDEDRTLLTALGGLVGQALERARLYDVEHARSQELQRGLLPRMLPRLPATSAAARYLPAGRDEDVGGDWYDVIPLSADRVALVIGDVMGHGITEAAIMGRLRTAVRTLADLEMPPDELFIHLNDLVSDLGEDSYATCLYAVFDPVAGRCTYSLAGHPYRFRMPSQPVSCGFAGRSAGSVVLIDQSGDGLPAFDPGCWQGDDVGIVQRCELAAALMRPMPVEVARVVLEDLLGVAAVEDQEPVGALLAC